MTDVINARQSTLSDQLFDAAEEHALRVLLDAWTDASTNDLSVFRKVGATTYYDCFIAGKGGGLESCCLYRRVYVVQCHVNHYGLQQKFSELSLELCEEMGFQPSTQLSTTKTTSGSCVLAGGSSMSCIHILRPPP